MLYKYVPITSRSYESILSRREVYFASPDQLNDPFEFRPHYEMPSIEKIKDYLKKIGISHSDIAKKLPYFVEHFQSNVKTVRDTMSEVYNKSAVLCMTPHPDNLLMWAHYGESHKGVCIGFDINLPYDEEFGYGYPVEYEDEYPRICMTEIDMMLRSLHNHQEMQKYDDITTRCAFTKAKVWRYENEVRFYRDLRRGPGLMDFEASKLKEVILGVSFPIDKIESITEMVRINFPDAALKKASLSKNRYQLEISNI